jgi:hypothetical protein
MVKLTIAPDPTPDLAAKRYDEAVFPQFRVIFQPPHKATSSLIQHLLHEPEEAAISVVLENLSTKNITALKYRCVVTDTCGKIHPRTHSIDSYSSIPFRPVVATGSRLLVTPSGSVNESFIEAVFNNLSGGMIVASIRGGQLLTDIAELSFEIHLALFDDGEVVGRDPDRFARELRCRKPAAEFVAKQIRQAEAEGRDVTPVLSAFASAPIMRGDHIARWISRYSREYLRPRGRESCLYRFEHMPVLPRFYRKGQ